MRRERSILAMLVAMFVTAGLVATVAEAEQSASILDSIVGGTPSLNARLRYENANADGAESSDALTLRTRLGYSTLPYHGIRGFVEFEDVSSFVDDDEYNQAGLNTGGAGKTVIADVEGTELNQAFIEAVCPHGSSIKAGRQRLILGNARFIGNVGWRQNEQTYDAAVLTSPEVGGLKLTYGYLDTVYRIFGQENGSQPSGAAGNAASYSSDSHIVNLGYTPCKAFSATAYAYLLDLGDRAVGSANSSDTYGINAKVTLPSDLGITTVCSVEYAQQTDNSASPADVDYDAEYVMIDVGGKTDDLGLGIGLEVLGSDNGATFRTPLATGHKFNGWADVFLTAPAQGLKDLYAYASVKCPFTDGTLKAVYHSFKSDVGSIEYGDEIDVVASKKLNDRITVIAKYANYQADKSDDNPRAPDVERISVEASLAF